MRRVLALLLLASPAWAQSPCDGKITDKLDHPLVYDAVPKPAPGKSYVDPVFGSFITRISRSDPSEGTSAVTRTTYNTQRGWNSDGSLIMAWDRGGNQHYEIYQGDKPYSFLFTLDFTGAPESPSDIEDVMWAPDDPNVLYFTGGYGRGTPKGVIEVTLQRDGEAITGRTFRLLHDWVTECALYNDVERMRLGSDPHSMSYVGGKYIGVVCGSLSGSGGNRLHIMYNITTDTTIKTFDLGSGISSKTAPWPCPSGTCWWWVYGRDDETHPNRVYDIDGNETGVSVVGVDMGEHSALAFTPGGYDTYNTVNFDGDQPFGTLVSYRLDTGVRRDLITQAQGWPYPRSGTHPSTGAADGSGWVAVSGIGHPLDNQVGQRVLENELLMVNVYTGEVCRVAHVRTHEARVTGGYQWNYWAEPHPQISRDGYRVLFNSDWLGSSTVDLYVIDLRPQDTTILTTSMPNAVTTEPYSKPLSIAGGQPPYVCTVSLGIPPTGLSLSDCEVQGTSTQVETQIYTIQACDFQSTPQCDSKGYIHTTQERPVIATISPLPSANVGSLYTEQFSATRGVLPYVWTTAGNTCSTSFSADVLTGTPLCLETCSFSATVTDSHAQPISATNPFEFDVVIPSGVCPCAPTDLSVEVSE